MKLFSSDVVAVQLFHSGDDVAELADAGRLDDDAVGMIRVQHLCRATSAKSPTRLQQIQPEFISVISYAGIFEESAVDADLTEFILDEDDLLAAERLVRAAF